MLRFFTTGFYASHGRHWVPIPRDYVTRWLAQALCNRSGNSAISGGGKAVAGLRYQAKSGFVSEARALGIRTCEINLEPSDNAEQFNERRYGLASEAVPAWVDELRKEWPRPAGQAFLTEMSQSCRGSKIDWTSAAKDALLWVSAGGHGHPVKHLGLASRFAGLWVVRASIPAPRTNGAQTMSTLSIKSRNTKSAAPKKGSAQSKTASRRKVTSPAANAKRPTRSVKSKTERVAAAKTRVKIDQPKVERVTKQERVLTLLSQSEGASIEEMMQATDWQQHSVRGFLAGTVKRKLGFSLTSLKPNDGVRRYRIETRRTR